MHSFRAVESCSFLNLYSERRKIQTFRQCDGGLMRGCEPRRFFKKRSLTQQVMRRGKEKGPLCVFSSNACEVPNAIDYIERDAGKSVPDEPGEQGFQRTVRQKRTKVQREQEGQEDTGPQRLRLQSCQPRDAPALQNIEPGEPENDVYNGNIRGKVR